jgi:glutaredoxin
MAEEKKKEEGAKQLSQENMLYFWGVGGLVLGLIIGFLVFPGMGVTPATGGAAAANGTFVLDNAKVANIAALLEDNIFISSGQQTDVTYVRYADQGEFIELYYNIGGQEMPVYVSRDYKYIYPSGALEISVVEEQMRTLREQAAADTASQAAGVPKSDSPQVLMFVMSYCPYGNQAEAGLVPVVDQLADNVEFEPVYIIYPSGGECAQNNGTQYCSLHGNAELWQDVREKIIFNMYGERKWAEYVGRANTECSLTDIGTCWLTVANETGVDAAAVVAEFDANKFGILDAEIEKTTQYGVRSSPTIIINEYTYSGSRTPAAYQAKVCEAFNSAPGACGSALSDSGAAASGDCG